MDADRFDALSRSLAIVLTRRGTLSGFATGSLLALGLDEATGLAKKKKGQGKKGNKKKRCSFGNPIRCGKFCCRSDEACKDGACVSHCFDGKHNFGEADTDCGRICKQRHRDHGLLCGLDRRCAGPEDCLSFVCVERQPGAGTVCVECEDDARCQILGLGRRCLEHTCVECAADFDCPSERPFCVAADGCPNNEPCACGTCRVDDDCPDRQICDETGTCTGGDCTGDEDCGGSFCNTTTGACVLCRTSADCPLPNEQTCDAAGFCVGACREHFHCNRSEPDKKDTCCGGVCGKPCSSVSDCDGCGQVQCQGGFCVCC